MLKERLNKLGPKILSMHTAGRTVELIYRETGIYRALLCQFLIESGCILNTHKKARYISPDLQKEICKARVAGAKYSELMKRFNLSHSGLYGILRRNEVPEIRFLPHKAHIHLKELNKNQRQKIIDLYNKGNSRVSIAKAMSSTKRKVTEYHVKKVIEEAGITRKRIHH